MRVLFGLVLVAALVAPAVADYYVAGDFNGWNAAGNLMTESPPGKWSTTIAAPGRHEFKVTVGDWSTTWPGDNAKADFGATALTINFYPTPAADGWNPTANRVGYDDLGLNTWDIMGSFNGWSSPVVTLTAMGSGLYQGDYQVATAGQYFFKFRWAGDWDISVGSDFSNYGHDIELNVANNNDIIRFSLDLPNGRWKTEVVPEPATLAGLLLGLALLRRR